MSIKEYKRAQKVTGGCLGWHTAG